MCNCFRDGKTTSPPFPRDWLEIDEEGYLHLKPGHDSDDNWHQLYQWQQDCCAHEQMEYGDERISNWGGYRQFQEALGEIGWEFFPVLQDQLPNGNGGLMDSAKCAQALPELDHFVSQGVVGIKTVLVDSRTGEVLWEYVAAYDGIVVLAGSLGFDAGLSEFEFFAVARESGEDLFRATHFRQYRQDGEKITGDSDTICWKNLDTGEIYASRLAIAGKAIPWEDGNWTNDQGQHRFEYPEELHVEQRPWPVTDFDFIVTALRKIFQASVETGNPVRWC
ncbi:hypothetical protein [Bremerella volcania]|nr:hypothetical protein [Bremerella volcania]